MCLTEEEEERDMREDDGEAGKGRRTKGKDNERRSSRPRDRRLVVSVSFPENLASPRVYAPFPSLTHSYKSLPHTHRHRLRQYFLLKGTSGGKGESDKRSSLLSSKGKERQRRVRGHRLWLERHTRRGKRERDTAKSSAQPLRLMRKTGESGRRRGRRREKDRSGGRQVARRTTTSGRYIFNVRERRLHHRRHTHRLALEFLHAKRDEDMSSTSILVKTVVEEEKAGENQQELQHLQPFLSFNRRRHYPPLIS